jgi:hypothetical protein
LQCNGRKSRITIGVAGDDIFGQKVVCLLRMLYSDSGIGFGLNPGRKERKYREFDASAKVGASMTSFL